MMGSPNSSAMLHRGSLFYELSMQLKEEMRQSSTLSPAGSTQQEHEASNHHGANQSFSQKNSPDASAAKTAAGHQNNLPSLNLALDLDDNNTDLSDTRNDDDDEIKQYFATSNGNGTQHRGSLDEQDILKEVRFATAAAASSLHFTSPSLSVCHSPFRNVSSFSC